MFPFRGCVIIIFIKSSLKYCKKWKINGINILLM
jgi:hypothetical protein